MKSRNDELDALRNDGQATMKVLHRLLVMADQMILTGLFCFSINVIFYFLALRSIPLSVAYPLMTIFSFLLINGYAIFGLKENMIKLFH